MSNKLVSGELYAASRVMIHIQLAVIAGRRFMSLKSWCSPSAELSSLGDDMAETGACAVHGHGRWLVVGIKRIGACTNRARRASRVYVTTSLSKLES